MSRFQALLFIIFSSGQLFAQDIFSLDSLHVIRISFDSKDYNKTLTKNYRASYNSKGDIYLKSKIDIDGKTINNVGIRYKGKSSYANDLSKKSLKIDFNEFTKGQKFQGLRKLNLHNAYPDASFIRDAISYHLFHEIGVSAPRLSFAHVYINDNYQGVYQIVEQIDKSFTKNKLFKNTGWKAFEYHGNSIAKYKRNIEQKGDEDKESWRRLIEFMRIVNNEDGQTFKTQLEAVFDVDTFLKCLLVYIATNNYDSVIGSGRNWYLALDKKTQKFKLIPWDNGVSLSANFPSVLQDCNIQPGFCYEKVSRRTFSFNDTSIHQGPMRRLWDLGDGTSSKSNSFTHTYSKNGNYTVCLTLSSIAECSEKVCHEINTRKKTEKCDDVLGSYYEYNFPLYLDYTNNPLISKIFTIPEFREKMRVITCEFLETTLSVSNMNTFIEQHQLLLEKAVKFDPNLLLDYSYFEREVIDLQSPYNLRKILEQRINFLTDEANCKSY